MTSDAPTTNTGHLRWASVVRCGLLLSFAFSLAGCDTCRGSASTPPPDGATAAPTPDPITHPCVVTAAQYSIAIEKGSDACASDSDCDCYQGGIGKSGCGGVLNKESVSKLDAIAKSFHGMKCQLAVDCAAWACEPRCEAGHCKR
ncbi:MAG: hypothetical protein IT377_12355 [Polyangiaceae bacterium]|nr:hypothetical protein [Polyangiaceae bacterium]